MVHLSRDPSDDPAFLDLTEKAINAAAASASSQFVHVVKIDSWFGDRWYQFSGKTLGAVGVFRRRRMTVPPFHPHRVVSEVRFRTADPGGMITDVQPLHAARTSESNLRNYIAAVGDSITIGWYSGDTQTTARGSIMVYSAAGEESAGWYAGLERTDHWRPDKLVGIDLREWAAFQGGHAAAR